MDAPERVVWSEGMLISPQHLQQQVLYHERLLDTRLGSMNPYNWGVLNVELDANALAGGQVDFQHFIGVFPGGLPVSFEKGKRAGPAPRPLGDSFLPTQRVLQVFLGVPREREGVPNVARAEEKDARARFSAATREVSDLTSGRVQQVSVSFARSNCVILFDAEANDDFDCLKVAEVVRNKNGEFELSKTYVPPCMQIGASPFITSGLRRLLGLMSAKQRALAETTRESSASSLEFRSSDITTFLQLQAITSMLPLVQHLAETAVFSPWQTYVYLTQTTGQLMTFSPKADPTALPKFTFTDLRATFTQLFEQITELLSGTVVKKFVKVDVKLFRNGVMVGELEEDAVRKASVFILTAKPMVPEVAADRMTLDLPKLSKIGAKSNIKNLIQAASNGVPLQVTHRPPPEIPIRDGVVYFQLNTEHEAWKTIVNEHNVALFMPKPYSPGNVTFELLAVPAQ